MLEENGFDYIDVDPFGTPNPFLDSAVKRLARDGILAVTATDTGCLSGTFPEACKRKYFAKPLLNELKHELGLRILIRKVQLIGAQLNKALIPIFSHSTLHYFRIYFRCKKGKQEADKIIEKHKYFLYCNKCMKRFVGNSNKHSCCGEEMEHAGPLWVDKLWDQKLVKKMKPSKFVNLIKEESKIDDIGFYDIHVIAKKYKKPAPKTEKISASLKQKGYSVARTHFSKYGIKTNAKIEEIIKLF
jgi:tRNA (guanine26-N2/guanine27-N2)-dimethyltransferase